MSIYLTRDIKQDVKLEYSKEESVYEDIIIDIRNLTYKLKYFYQRPRPYQLAQYFKLKLFLIMKIQKTKKFIQRDKKFKKITIGPSDP